MEEEIVIRKNIYTGKEHKLRWTGDGVAYEFIPAEEWMPITINYWTDDEDDPSHKVIESIDCDGFGYPLSLGEKIEDKEVKAIIEVNDKILILID